MNNDNRIDRGTAAQHTGVEKLLLQVIEYDERAQELTRRAEGYKADAKQTIADNEARLRKEYAKRAESRIAQIESEAKAAADEASDGDAYLEDGMKKLHKQFDAGREEWLNRIVDSTLGR